MKHADQFVDLSDKRVSYLYITKNHEGYSRKLLRELPKLVKPVDELIVIDGLSRDRTRETIFANQDRVAVFLSERDLNTAHAINKGILMARGKYIAFLLNEDTINPEAMERAIAVLDLNPEIDVLVCGGLKHFKTSATREFSRPFYYPPGTNYGKSPEDAFHYGACGNGFLIRRSVFAKVGLFPTEAVLCDVVFIAQCIYHGGVVKFCRLNLFDHYINEESNSLKIKQRIDNERKGLKFIKRYCSPTFIKKRELRHLGRRRFLKFSWYQAVISYWLKKFLFGQEKVKAPSNEYIWDGGFS